MRKILIIALVIVLTVLCSCEGSESLVTDITIVQDSVSGDETAEPVLSERLTGESVVLRAQDNPSLGGDISSYELLDGGLYLFLPGGVELSRLAVTALDGDDNALDVAYADFERGGLVLETASGDRRITALASTLPALFIELDESRGSFAAMEASADKSASCYGKLALTSDGGTLVSGDIRLRGRGNWTWLRDKKGYALKLSSKESLLGMETSRNWVLLANVADSSLMRDIVSFGLAADMGLEYSPECAPVELYINGEYRGSYLLSEKIEIASSRIDIYDLEKETEKLNPDIESYETAAARLDCGARIKYAVGIVEPEDVSGGYLVEIELSDRYAAEPCGFVTRRGYCFVVKSPEWAGEHQITYIAQLYQRLEDALFADDGIDPESGQHYTALTDLTTAARKYALEELSKNFDANHSSQYSYKPRDDQSSLIFFGPVWDMDAAFGNTEATWSYEGWWAASAGWWAAFMKHEDFRSEVARVLRDELLPLCDALVGGGIADYETQLAPSASMNFLRWNHMGVKPTESTYISTGDTYAESVAQLRDFISRRATWIAAQFGV